jgi:ADP-ribosylglycohydrolase
VDKKISAYQGCLLGLAVGDAMGYTVDKKTWDEICEDYGPNGLLGYDLVNGSADITSYTQLAAFLCNGLLLGAIRGDPEKYSRYMALGLR